MEQMKNNSDRKIQKRKLLRNHEPFLNETITVDALENGKYTAFDPECVLSMTNIPIGCSQNEFSSEKQYIETVSRLLSTHHIKQIT
eukprot:773785_1